MGRGPELQGRVWALSIRSLRLLALPPGHEHEGRDHVAEGELELGGADLPGTRERALQDVPEHGLRMMDVSARAFSGAPW